MLDALALGRQQLDELGAAVLMRGSEDLREIGAEACMGHGCSSGSGACGVTARPAARERRTDAGVVRRTPRCDWDHIPVGTNLPGVVRPTPINRAIRGLS